MRFPAIGELPYLLTLAGHGFYWFRLRSDPRRAEAARSAPSSAPSGTAGPSGSALRAGVRHGGSLLTAGRGHARAESARTADRPSPGRLPRAGSPPPQSGTLARPAMRPGKGRSMSEQLRSRPGARTAPAGRPSRRPPRPASDRRGLGCALARSAAARLAAAAALVRRQGPARSPASRWSRRPNCCPPGGRLGATSGLLHLLARRRAARPRPPRRLLPTAARRPRRCCRPRSRAPRSAGHVGGPLDGLTLYEALHDPRLAALLLERLRLPGRTGRAALPTEPRRSRPGRPAAAAVHRRAVATPRSIYGDAYILKLFRRVSPAPTPTWNCRSPSPATGSPAGRRAGRLVRGAGLPDGDADGTARSPRRSACSSAILPGSTDGWELALRGAGRRTATSPPRPARWAAPPPRCMPRSPRALPTVTLGRRS